MTVLTVYVGPYIRIKVIEFAINLSQNGKIPGPNCHYTYNELAAPSHRHSERKTE